jgi:hypothetical protein
MSKSSSSETQERLRKEQAEQQANLAKQKADRETARAEQLELFKSEIADNDRSMRAATKYLLKAVDLGATQRMAAEKVGKSESWVNRLLKWGRGGFKDTGPFSTDAKAKRVRTARNIRRLKKSAEEQRHGIGGNNPPPDEPVERPAALDGETPPAAADDGSSPPTAEPPSNGNGHAASEPATTNTKSTAKSSAINAADIALEGFTARVLDLVRRIAKHDAERFVRTAVEADKLLKVGAFFTELGHLKSGESADETLH